MAQLLNFSEAVSRIKSIRSAARSADEVKAPGWLLLALEGRALWELWASVLTLPILRQAPEGDGHPVVVFPGLAISIVVLLTNLLGDSLRAAYDPRAQVVGRT